MEDSVQAPVGALHASGPQVYQRGGMSTNIFNPTLLNSAADSVWVTPQLLSRPLDVHFN